MSYDSLTDDVMRKQAKVCAELRAEVERLRATDKEAKSAFAPWVQGPGIVGGILHLQEEVERLRADANARAVEELGMQAEGCDRAAAGWARELAIVTDAGHRDRLESRINQLEGVAFHIRKRIAELSKPAAEESEPVQANTFNIYGVTFTADPKAPRSAVQQALAWIGHAFTSVTTMVETTPEEPVQDERCGDWPLRDYVNGYNPLTASPLETAVYHLCKTAVRK